MLSNVPAINLSKLDVSFLASQNTDRPANFIQTGRRVNETGPDRESRTLAYSPKRRRLRALIRTVRHSPPSKIPSGNYLWRLTHSYALEAKDIWKNEGQELVALTDNLIDCHGRWTKTSILTKYQDNPSVQNLESDKSAKTDLWCVMRLFGSSTWQASTFHNPTVSALFLTFSIATETDYRLVQLLWLRFARGRPVKIRTHDVSTATLGEYLLFLHFK